MSSFFVPTISLKTSCACGKDVVFGYFKVLGCCYDCILNCPEKEETNESFGRTMEWLVTKIYHLSNPPSEHRINKKDITPDLFNILISKLSLLPLISEYTGAGQNPIDFITITGKTINLKTNKANNSKICPNTIGQITKKKFMNRYNINNPETSTIKQYILEHPKELLKDYYEHLFSCDYTIWILENKVEIFYTSELTSLFSNISFTRSLADWNESNTIKSDGKTIGEFQIHNIRDNVKFRFNMKEILPLIKKTSIAPLSLNYIGSKKTLLPKLEIIFRKYSQKDDIFCDMFCGTAIITYMASRLKTFHKVISNDIMYYGYVMGKAMLVKGSSCSLYPINLNIPENYEGGFITHNYSGTYFTRENAKIIDWIRNEIEEIKDEKEENTKMYLLASLLSSADKVANTASVYGAYLKKFKSSALKKLVYTVPSISPPDCEGQVFNLSSEDLLLDDIDFLYLDPPYNSRGYDSNYHILETIAKNDNPQIKGKTGLRVIAKKSDYCSKLNAKRALDTLLKRSANVRVVVLSYNDDGICKVNDIIEMFKERELDIYRINYSKFNSHKESPEKRVYEYIFVGVKGGSGVRFFDIL